MMRSIEEEEFEGNKSQGSHHVGFASDTKKSKEKLNMAELRASHKKLQDKIAESQKKVLEEGLRRQRLSSNIDREQVRKSITNLELGTDATEMRESA